MLPERVMHRAPIRQVLHQQQRPFVRVTQRQYKTRLRVTASTGAPKLQDQQAAAILKQIMNYSYQVDTPEGQLVITAMRVQWLERAADLLTDTFVDTKGIQPYRRYVRRNISKYLDQHMKMPPEAVVVTAVMRSQVIVDPQLDVLVDLSSPQPTTTTSSSTLSVSHVVGSGNSSSTNTNVSTPSGNPPSTSSSSFNPWHWLTVPDNSGLDAAAVSHDNTITAQANPISSGSSVSSSGSSVSNSASANTQAISASTSSSISTSSTIGLGSHMGSMVMSALQHLQTGLGLQAQKQVQARVVEQLVGLAEVSFKEKTRSQALTLNPPAKCAYLCNMAVAPNWRRRGIASHLINAIEDMCSLAGEYDIYLHLRLKDTDNAGGLYKKAGYTVRKQDWPIIFLLGQEPRYLMKKELTLTRQLMGCVKLDDAGQGDGQAGVVPSLQSGAHQIQMAESPATSAASSAA